MRQPPGRRSVPTLVEAERGIWEINDYLSYIRGQVLTITGQGSTTSVGVPHGLGRIPQHFIVVGQDGDGALWHDASDTWTTASVVFRGTNTVTFKVRVY